MTPSAAGSRPSPETDSASTPDEAIEVVAEHVERCPDCQSTLATLVDAEDTLVVELGGPPDSDPYADEPECRELLAAAKVLAGVPAGQPGGQTPAQPASAAEQPGDSGGGLGCLGEYELLAKLGEGGMGAVYKARQTRLRKIVALKVLPKDRTTDPRAVSRFEREMQAVGQLSHPNIVHAYDARDIEGTTVLVMEYVEGMDLGQVVQHVGALRTADACELVRQAALGLQCAHENGLVHRDIKPSNLMLALSRTDWQSVPQLKILDLGLALLGTDQPGTGELTSAGEAMGTPDYMAPEQVSDAHSVDIRADVYSLGCTLFKLLTSRAPFSGPKYKNNTQKLVGHLHDAPPPIRLLRTDVSAELAAVIERMMAKDPSQRFSTPAEVGAAMAPFAAGCDLGRMSAEARTMAGGAAKVEHSLAASEPQVSSAMTGTGGQRAEGRGEKVVKSPGTALTGIGGQEQLRTPYSVPRTQAPVSSTKYVRPAVAVCLGLVGVAVALGIVLKIRDRQGRETVVTLPEGSEVTIEQTADGDRASPLPSREGPRSVVPGVRASGTPPAPAIARRGAALAALPPLDPTQSASPVPFKTEARAPLFSAGENYLRRTLVPRPAKIEGADSWTIVTRGHRWPITGVAYRPDGRVLATGADWLRLWDPQSGRLIKTLVDFRDQPPYKGAWSPRGDLIAVGSGNGAIRIWDVASAQVRTVLRGHAKEIEDVAWSPDGRLLASCAQERGSKEVYVWDLASGSVRQILRPEIAGKDAYARVAAWSPDGKRLASAGYQLPLTVWDVESGKALWAQVGPTNKVEPLSSGGVAWSPDGKIVAMSYNVSNMGTVMFADGETGKILHELPRYQGTGYSLAWSPDGNTVAAGGETESSVRVWDRSSYSLKYVLSLPSRKGKWHWCFGLEFSPDNRSLAAGSLNGTVRIWDAESGQVRHELPVHPGAMLSIGVSPRDDLLASGHDDGVVRIWDLAARRIVREIRTEGRVPGQLVWSPDGTLLAVAYTLGFGFEGFAHLVDVYDAATGRHVAHVSHDEKKAVASLAWSPDGKTLATATLGLATLWEMPSGTRLRTIEPVGEVVAFSPRGDQLAARFHHHVRILDPSTGQVRKELGPQDGSVLSVAWAADGKSLFCGTHNKTISRWDLESGKYLPLLKHGEEVWALHVTPDGKQLVVAGAASVKFWDLSSGAAVSSVELAGQGVGKYETARLIVGPEQVYSIVAGRDIRIQSRDSGNVLGTLVHLGGMRSCFITPEGHWDGPPEVGNDLVYVVQTDAGQLTLTPEEFDKKYGWKNDPAKARPAGQ